MAGGHKGADTTETRDGAMSIEAPQAVQVLEIAWHPDRRRMGEQVPMDLCPMDLDRVTAVFPGGCLSEPGLSRRHARIERSPEGGITLRDLDSKNGTFLNGRRVTGEGCAVRPGDAIRMGEVVLLLHEVEVPPPDDAGIDSILGRSQAARRLRGSIARIAPRSAPVLVLGETGTGKDLVARALASQGRPGRPFLALNVGATPAALVESVLFGHARGAFTDARDARPGLFRACDRGTLFLDEVGDMTPEVQVKLLRAVEEGRFLPVGEARTFEADVRIVAATNRDLLSDVRNGRFRPDLYARLSQLVIECPPLRERREDIPLLAIDFSEGRPFVAQAMCELVLHPWPFNVRELRAVVESCMAETPRGPLILPPLVIERLEGNRRYFLDQTMPCPSLTREVVEGAIERAGGNMSRAASDLGKDRGQFYRIARRLGVELGRFRRYSRDGHRREPDSR